MSGIVQSNAFDRAQVRDRLAELAQQGIFIGTSSWKYQGWRGVFYEDDRYIWRGKFSASRFERQCLSDYAEVFKTVCVDAAYYKFPDERHLQSLVSQVPADFQFTFKVTDEITIKRFPNVPRSGARAGQANPDFLNADLFISSFLAPSEPFRKNIGALIFEFSRFYPEDFARGRDFVDALDAFLAKLPRGWDYGVEIRNRHFLQPEYFATLARHGVTHVFNSWSDMPPIEEQLALPDNFPNPNFAAARFLLKPGRSFQQAVDLFRPYDNIKEPLDDTRAAAVRLIRHVLRSKAVRKLYLYINNRLEGNAPLTILALLAEEGKINAPTAP